MESGHGETELWVGWSFSELGWLNHGISSAIEMN